MSAWIAWKLARVFWFVRLDRIGNHFEDIALCGKPWIGKWDKP